MKKEGNRSPTNIQYFLKPDSLCFSHCLSLFLDQKAKRARQNIKYKGETMTNLLN